jgi:hypothetical protein
VSDPEIPFLTELRREFRNAAIAQAHAERRSWRRRTLRFLPALLLVFAGAAAAKTLLFEPTPTRLVADGLQCVSGTSNAAHFSAVDVEPYGRTPAEACSNLLGVPAARLTPCYDRRHGTVVFESTGRADQCETLKMAPLPAGYTAATARVARLQSALNHVYDTHVCLTPAQLATQSQHVLDRLGFVGWTTRLFIVHGQASHGSCGQYPGIGNRPSDATAALIGHGDSVAIQNGPPRPIATLLTSQVGRLAAKTGSSCHTTAAAQALAQRVFAAHRLTTRFALTQEPKGEGFEAGDQRQYDHGCTAIISPTTAPNGHTILIWMINRHAPKMPYGTGIPSLAMYRTANHQ